MQRIPLHVQSMSGQERIVAQVLYICNLIAVRCMTSSIAELQTAGRCLTSERNACNLDELAIDNESPHFIQDPTSLHLS
jgi:hypothetical protein